MIELRKSAEREREREREYLMRERGDWESEGKKRCGGCWWMQRRRLHENNEIWKS
jgi:hypothetical protein